MEIDFNEYFKLKESPLKAIYYPIIKLSIIDYFLLNPDYPLCYLHFYNFIHFSIVTVLVSSYMQSGERSNSLFILQTRLNDVIIAKRDDGRTNPIQLRRSHEVQGRTIPNPEGKTGG